MLRSVGRRRVPVGKNGAVRPNVSAGPKVLWFGPFVRQRKFSLAGRCAGAPPFGQRRMVMRQLVSRFVRDERGMETVEWGVLAALIVAGLVGVISGLGGNVLKKFQNLQTATS